MVKSLDDNHVAAARKKSSSLAKSEAGSKKIIRNSGAELFYKSGKIMLKEQLLGLVMKAYSRAFEAKERLKSSISNEVVQNYLVAIRNIIDDIIPGNNIRKTPLKKKRRKTSIRPAKEIVSSRADLILQGLNDESHKYVLKSEALDGKTSLAYLVWALGHAELANITDGISVHDVSALLYRACKIELYPINISRVVYKNPLLVRQAGQLKRTKTYLLTEKGQTIFREKFL